MHVDVRKEGDVVVVDFEGRLVAGVGDELLSEVINQLLALDHKKILLNLAKVDSIDSMGLGELVQSRKISERFGASLKLLQPHDRVRHTLHLTRVLPMFEVHESEEDAVASFA